MPPHLACDGIYDMLQQAECRNVTLKDVFSNLISRRLNAVLYIIVATLCLASIIFVPSSSQASDLQERTWSMRFNNAAIGDTLKQLSQVTGVEISTNKTPSMERITRSYESQTLEHIIRDVLRGTSYTLVWHYGANDLESVGICFFDAGRGKPRSQYTDMTYRPVNRVPNMRSAQTASRGRGKVRQPAKRPVRKRLAASKSKSKAVTEDMGEDDSEDEGFDEEEFEDEDE